MMMLITMIVLMMVIVMLADYADADDLSLIHI